MEVYCYGKIIYKQKRLYLIGQPLSADPDGYKPPNGAYEGAGISNFANPINGMNSMSVFNDKFTEETFLGTPGLLQLSILPAIPINYYGLIGKSLLNMRLINLTLLVMHLLHFKQLI